MSEIAFVSFLYNPRVVRETALGQSDLAAIMVNSLSGALVIAAMAISAPWPLTTTLILVLAVLYGILLGFTMSSLYSVIETILGGKLGGRAPFSVRYRLLAWSFLPIACVFFVCLLIEEYSGLSTAWIDWIQIVFLTVSALIYIRNYYTNYRHVQGLSHLRSVVSLVLSFALFIILVVVGLKYLIQLFLYGTNLDVLG